MMTENGVTTTKMLGQEQYEYFKHAGRQVKYCAYDYRHTDGKLFSCVAPSLEIARKRKDKWLQDKEKTSYSAD